jgi:archaeosine synthase
MLEVLARSQRGRICEFRIDNITMRTPAVLRVLDEYAPASERPDVHVSVDGGKRILVIGNRKTTLDRGLRTVLSSGHNVEPVIDNNVCILRLPLKGDEKITENVDIAVISNAFELRKDPRKMIDSIMHARRTVGHNVLLYAPGLADPSNIALLAYMGIDLFDDSLPVAAGRLGMLYIPEGEVRVGGDVSQRNLDEIVIECSKVMMFTGSGRLRELVDQRVSSPSLVAALRIFDRAGYEYQEEMCATVGGRFSCNTTQSLLRPETERFRRMLNERYEPPKHKRILVLLPCSAKKPYHTSKTHRAFASAIHTGDHDVLVHEVIVTSPLGIVPRELDIFYPASSYDIPVTGEWKCQEREMIRNMLSKLLEFGYECVISHLGDTTDLIREFADLTETCVGDPTSPVSLKNLEDAVRDAAAGMEKCGYHTDRCENVRSVLRFQFGREAADILMEGASVTGKYPYWKIHYGKVQLGMMSEERSMISLTMEGAERLSGMDRNIVEMTDFELKGSLFAVGVSKADRGIRAGDEVIVRMNDVVKAVGVAAMSGAEMEDLKRGVAVKIRHKAK